MRIGEFETAARKAEGEEPDTFLLCGEEFTVAGEIGFIGWGRFAQAARAGLDTMEMDGLAALMDVIQDIVVDADQYRFTELCRRRRVDGDTLMGIVQAVMEREAGRPTRQPSGSSGGQSTTTASSTGSSLSPIQRDPRVAELRPVARAAEDVMVMTG